MINIFLLLIIIICTVKLWHLVLTERCKYFDFTFHGPEYYTMLHEVESVILSHPGLHRHYEKLYHTRDASIIANYVVDEGYFHHRIYRKDKFQQVHYWFSYLVCTGRYDRRFENKHVLKRI